MSNLSLQYWNQQGWVEVGEDNPRQKTTTRTKARRQNYNDGKAPETVAAGRKKQKNSNVLRYLPETGYSQIPAESSSINHKAEEGTDNSVGSDSYSDANKTPAVVVRKTKTGPGRKPGGSNSNTDPRTSIRLYKGSDSSALSSLLACMFALFSATKEECHRYWGNISEYFDPISMMFKVVNIFILHMTEYLLTYLLLII